MQAAARPCYIWICIRSNPTWINLSSQDDTKHNRGSTLSEFTEKAAFPMRRRTFLKQLFGAVWAAQVALRSETVWAAQTAQPKGVDTDAYARYVRTSRDFRRVKQDRAWLDKAYPRMDIHALDVPVEHRLYRRVREVEPGARLQWRVFGREWRRTGLSQRQTGLDQSLRPALLHGSHGAQGVSASVGRG